VGSPAAKGGESKGDKEKKGGLPVHDLQTVTLEEAVAAFNDPEHKPGESDSKIFFIDAREDANFNEAHIPGALQVDHYRVEKYLPEVLEMIPEAKKIIVYCNGGDCEDSIHVCHDLIDAKVPYEKIYLFEGGMKAWKEAKQPVE
jgi:rhodanese-related sulfurtransferase